MLNGYIDDSGSEPSSPTFVLAGYVLPAEAWASFSDEWIKALASDKPIDFLHMKDTGKNETKGQFAGWAWEDIEDKLYSLAKVIHAHKPLALAAHTQWDYYQEFKSKSALAGYIQNPYKALFHEITRIMYYTGLKFGNPESVDFFFDEHGDIGNEAVSWYSEIKDAFPPEARSFFGSTPGFRDDMKVLPLQAADMIAWFQRRRIWKPVTRPRMLEIENLITEHFTVGSEIDAQGFEKAARDFERVARLRELKTRI